MIFSTYLDAVGVALNGKSKKEKNSKRLGGGDLTWVGALVALPRSSNFFENGIHFS